MFRFRVRTLLAVIALAAIAISGLDWWMQIRERWQLFEQAAAYHARLEQDYLKQQREQVGLVIDILKVDDQIERTMTVFSPGQIPGWKDSEAVFVDEVRQEASRKAAAAARRALFHARKRQEFQTRWW
jgi:Tfp pilus assembly protein PilO